MHRFARLLAGVLVQGVHGNPNQSYFLVLPQVRGIAMRYPQGDGLARAYVFLPSATEADFRGEEGFAYFRQVALDAGIPFEVLGSGEHELAKPEGAVIVMDEAAEERFQAPASDLDRFFYGFSLMACLPDGLSHQPSAGTGTVMRPGTFRRYAQEAGYRDVEILDALEHPFFRFYRLHA